MSNKITDFLNLHIGEADRDKVIKEIKSNISFKGANLWILACAIVIASVGLNVNSTAVIIGAMLISPLMGPIVGAGFALATYDFELLKRTAKNLLIATIVGLLVATIYFALSPYKEIQSELLARTSPTIYDVLIALFGGLVGAIAITRAEKGNPIPGVAIATALMQPLCTAGFGLAMGNIQYFLGAFYLYIINCFFICIATFAIIKFLKYQPVQALHKEYEKRIRYGISGIMLVMILPSFYLAYNLIQEKKYTHAVERFIQQEFTANGYTRIFEKIAFNDDPKTIELAFLNKKFSEKELVFINEKLPIYGLENTKLTIKQDISDIKNEILQEIESNDKKITQQEVVINNLQNELKRYKFDNAELVEEIKILFPEFKQISIGNHTVIDASDSTDNSLIIMFEPKSANADEVKLKKWLQQKLQTQQIKLIRLQGNN